MLDDKDARIRGLEARIVEKDTLCKELEKKLWGEGDGDREASPAAHSTPQSAQQSATQRAQFADLNSVQLAALATQVSFAPILGLFCSYTRSLLLLY
jgi:hypothetical protein